MLQDRIEEFTSHLPSLTEAVPTPKAWFTSTLDLTEGYWQVSLTPKARQKTVVSTASDNIQYKVLPFQLHRALDDTVIHFATWQDHLQHLMEVLGILCRDPALPNKQVSLTMLC